MRKRTFGATDRCFAGNLALGHVDFRARAGPSIAVFLLPGAQWRLRVTPSDLPLAMRGFQAVTTSQVTCFFFGLPLFALFPQQKKGGG